MPSTRTGKPAGHNRITGQKTEEVAEAARRAAEQAEAEGAEMDTEAATRLTSGVLLGRQQARKIKVDDDAPERERATSVDEAVVKRSNGLPDMRFATNRNKFSRDTTKRVNGDIDRRLLDNRPDILAAHVAQGEGMPNVIFGEDGSIEE